MAINVPNSKLTYCNPLPIPNTPRETFGDYSSGIDQCCRALADPAVLYHNNKWYLHPSYGMTWVTEDFRNWEYCPAQFDKPIFAPHVIPWNDRFLMACWRDVLYVADAPTGPFEELGDLILPDGTHFCPLDPGIFVDDDGRIYLYEVGFRPVKGLKFGITRIIGYELDQENPRKVVRGPAVVLEIDPGNNIYERFGQYNQDHRFGWMEGPHLIKKGSRYYLIYATPATQYATYVQCVAYSDEDPLAPMLRQNRNPLTARTRGLVQGPGHGCVVEGPCDSLWVFYSIATPYGCKFERRIGMDRVLIDEHGELYCPNGVSDMPQYAPGVETENVTPGLLPLTAWCRPTASSCAPGRDALYAVDESCFSWWQPADDDIAPILTCKLDTDFYIASSRVYWRDIGLDYDKNILPGPFQYKIEGLQGDTWVTLVDRSDSTKELNVDYQTFDAVLCSHVRLCILDWPEGIKPSVIDFSVFGVCPDLESN